MTHEAYSITERILKTFAVKKSLRLFLQRLISLFIILTIVLLAGISVKYLSEENIWLPFLYTIVSLSVLGLAALMAIFALARKTSLHEVALIIQQGQPELKDDLVNALQVYRQFLPPHEQPGISERLATAFIIRTAERLRQIDLRPLLKIPRLWPNALILIMLGITLGAVSLSDQTQIEYSMNLLLHPSMAAEYRRVSLSVKPGSVALLKGTGVLIEAIYSKPLEIETWLEMEQNGRKTRHLMSPAKKGLYKFSLGKFTESISYAVRSSVAKSGPYSLTAVEPPLVGKLHIDLVPPLYTGLENMSQEDNGNIMVYPGTEAFFTITPTREVREAKLIFDDQKSFPLIKKDDGTLQTQAVLLSQKNYRIELKDSLGFTDLDPIIYLIEIVPDLEPQVEIASPALDLEMNEGSELVITYVARDDFGISAVHLKYASAGTEEKSLQISGGPKARPLVSGQYAWQLSGPEFSHGSLITYYLEAEDNDTVSGPHRGISKTYKVKIRGREEEHKRLQDKIASITNDLLWLLGDQLELQEKISQALTPPGKGSKNETLALAREKKEEFQERLSRIAEEVASTLSEMAMDPMSSYLTYFDLQALQKNLDYLARTSLEKARQALEQIAARGGSQGTDEVLRAEERVTSGLEQAVLLSEGAGKKSKATDLASMSSNMLKEQGDLMDLLKRFLETGEGEVLEKFMEQVAGLQGKIAELMEKLMELAQSPPDEFLNLESLQRLDLSQMQKLLQQLQDAIKMGDMEKAMELAKSFMESLSKLVAMLQEMSSMASLMFQEHQKNAQSVLDELNRIIEEQRKILAPTESIHRDMSQRLYGLQLEKREELSRLARDELGRIFMDLDAQMKQMLKRGEIDKSDFTIYNQLRQRINKILGDLEKGDVSGFLEAVEGFSAELEETVEMFSAPLPKNSRTRLARKGLQQRLDNLQRLSQELRSLSPGPQHFTEAEKSKLKELSVTQDTLRKDTYRLATFIDGLSQLLPTLLPEIADDLWEANSYMGQAAGELEKKNTAKALPAENEALYYLKKAMDELKEAARQLSITASLSAMPMPLLMGQGMPLFPFFSLIPGMGYTEGGQIGQSLQPFKIPSREDYQVPRLLREEVLKALKEGYPSEFKEEVKKYFRNLSE